jgi:6-phosphogluconolactonase
MENSKQQLVLFSSYAPADAPSIYVFSFDGDTGALHQLASYTGITSPSFLVVHPNRKWIYAVSETGKDSHGMIGEVWAFRLEREPFSIQPISHQSTRGDWPCHLQLDLTGNWLIATNYGTGNACIYPLQPDGSLGEMADFVQHHGKGPNEERQEGPHAHSSILTPDNRFAIIADLGIDQLAIYQLDTSKGKLQLYSSINTRPGAGPRHLAFHPNGKWMYAANELDSTVTQYDYDAVNGTLIERQSLSTVPSGSPENIVADIHISDSGQRLYISNRGHNSIAVYDVGQDGNLVLVSIPTCGGDWPRNFALAPGGRFILVANQYSNEVCVLPVMEGTTSLGEPIARAHLQGASCIQFV